MSVPHSSPSATPRFAAEVRTTGLLALPLVLGHVSTGLIGFVDNVIAGHHGTATLADIDAALHEYETLAQGYPGEEARVRYAQLLQRTARTDQAKAMYEQVLRHAGASPKHYQREQRGWVELARKGLSELGTTA